MKITNKTNLPGALVTAAHLDEYSRGASDISATELIDSPRIRLMRQHYSDVVSKDVSSMVWPMLGTAFHNLMEKGEDDALETEERYFAEVEGWTLSGQIDRVEQRDKLRVIRDYKVTSVYTVMNPRTEWTQQLNVYAWLYWKTRGVFPTSEIVALCRDWRPREAEQRRSDGYPQTPIITLPISTWSPAYADEYVKERIRIHQDAQQQLDEHGVWPECTDEDRWAEPDRYAVMQKGRKRAMKLYDRKSDAQAHAKQSANYSVEPRHGGQRRCEGYCEFASVCTQYEAIIEERDVTAMVNEIKKA